MYKLSFADANVQTIDGDAVMPEDVLIFFTGAEIEPPLGYDQKPKLLFSWEKLASASTCSLRLTLPLEHYASYESFKDSMVLSLKGHDGFGKT